MRLSEKIAQNILPLGGQTILQFWRLHYDVVNNPNEFFPFHAGTNGLDNPVIFGGISYSPIPCEIDAIESNSLNRVSRPEIRISNANYQISQLLRRKNDFKNAKLVRIKTFLRYIDDSNFDGGQNPYGVPDKNAEISRDTFVIFQKKAENKQEVVFELSSSFDLSDQMIPGRTVLARYCPFQYRGKGCNYHGKPICKKDDSSFSAEPDFDYEISSPRNLWIEDYNYQAGNIVYVENISDPPRTVFVCKTAHLSTSLNHPNQDDGKAYWEQDDCSKQIGGCKKRFLDDPTNAFYLGYLPFGGFAGTESARLGG
jgi:lambda family phage minor tail protein L